MSYAIFRLAKLSSWSDIGGSGAHTYRTITTPNADPARAGMNYTGIGTMGDVVGDVRQRVDAVTSKPRSNAVLAIEFLLTASPEWFEGKSQADVKAWARANAAWLRETFGKDNVVHLVLHQDETTPHLVAYVVPEHNGRLNARAITGTGELLSDMHTSYAAAMQPFGLQRGIEGSNATHQTVKQWYGKLNAAAADGVRQVEAVPDPVLPPSMPLWTLPEARQKAMEAWQRDETGKRRKLAHDATVAALAASDARQEVQELKQDNAKLESEVAMLRTNLSEAYEALSLSKEDVAALRKSNTTLVANRLGHAGPILPKENAIDLLKRVGEFDYGQAVAWLHAEFGPVVTGAVVSKVAKEENAPRPFTKAENTIKQSVNVQLDALNSGKYRITLISYDETKKPYLLGKKNGEEKFYTKDEVCDLIPYLRFQNNQGMNVLITPMDDEQYYILLDDMKLTRAELLGKGFSPCLLQSTSWQSHQAVFKVPKDHDRESVIAVFNELNQKHGDADITGLRHPFRLAGFRNMKPKHIKDGLYPFVKLISAVNTMCRRCITMVMQVEGKELIHNTHSPKYRS